MHEQNSQRIRVRESATEEVSANAATIKILSLSLWLCVLTQKIALPGNIEITLPIMWATLLYLFARGAARLSMIRVLVFGGIFALIILTQVVFNSTFSVKAVLYVVPLYAVFNFFIPMSNRDYMVLLKNFSQIGMFAAIMTLLQWLTQFVGAGMLDVEKVIPESLLYVHYLYMQPVQWGSPWFQPNGVFFLEASFVCQAIGLGFLIELFIFQRPVRLGIMFVAMFSTYAGTGVLMVLLMAPFGIKLINKNTALLAAALAPLAIAYLLFSGLGDYFLLRVGEFGIEKSSGYGRFIEPYTLLARIYDRNHIGSIFAGIGPGNIERIRHLNITMVPNPFHKLIAEYGWFAGLTWFFYIHAIMFRSNTPYYVVVPVLLKYDLMNSSLLMPIEVAYCVLLVASIKLSKRLDYKSLIALARSVQKPQKIPVREYSPARLRFGADR